MQSSHPIFTAPNAWAILASHRLQQMRSLLGAIPPSGWVLLSSFVIQLSTVLAKTLFDSLGSTGTVLICKLFAALVLLAICRPRWQGHPPRHYGLVVLLGGTMALMSVSLYAAIDRIPIGVASTVEFLGPLGVSLWGSRRPLDLFWVVLAATGVVLFDPIGSSTLDPWGLGLALLAGGCWAAYILLSAQVGQVFPGGNGLSLGMAIATLFLAIPGIISGGTALLNPTVLVIGLVVACVGTVLPYSMEFIALKRMPPRVFGVLMSIEPAIAALVGFLFLHELLDVKTMVAIALVTTSAIGVTWFSKGSP